MTTRHIRPMIFICSALVVAAFSYAVAGQGNEVLTNESVVQMLVGKVPKNLILSKIQSTKSTFDVGADGLVSLKVSKVPTDVIKTMIQVTSAAGKKETLNNAAIMKMTSGGVPRDIIQFKIQTSTAAFDVAAAQLVALTLAKVDAAVLKVMIQSSPTGAKRTEILNNEAVISMVTGGVSRDVIITKIQSTRGKYDTSAAGLVSLNQNKVPETVVKAMIAAGAM